MFPTALSLRLVGYWVLNSWKILADAVETRCEISRECSMMNAIRRSE